MPILDPLLQYNLLFHKQEKKTPRSRQFLSKYLKIASKNIYRTYDTTKAYLQFKNDFREEISFIKSHFNCKNLQLDENIVVPNFYQFLDELIKKEDKNSEIEGDYFTISSTNRKFYYFQPYIEYSSSHSWIFTKSSIAILSIRMNNAELKKSLSLINLEVDIMIASGFTLVLCVSGFENCSVDNALYLKKIICKNLFAELHINYDSISYQESFYNFLKELSNSYTKFDSYVYIYSQKIRSSNDQNDSSQILKCDILFKYLKTLPCFQTFIVNDSIEKSLKKCKIAKTEPFKLFQNGFISDTLNIMLCDVPLYDTDDDIQNSAPYDFVYLDSSKRLGRISKEDFLFWKKTRIQIEIMNSNNDTITKYIDFDDIHLVNLELYVNNPIYLGKVDSDEIKSIENIINKTQNKYENQKDVKFKKEFFLLLFKEKKISKILAYVLYAYKKYSKNFLFLHNQVYIAHKTIKFCIANESTKNNRGFVYQVPTGEGKSSIVILIAAVLALFGKKVHVVSSNIVLANRDYNDSYEFFKKLGLKSSALLHYNEMPNFADENSGISEFNYPETYFSQMEFDNPIQMNLIACDEYGKADIVFSTLINFEIYYLYMTEKYPSLSNSFYRNISLVIDEADLVLIDELTNGTIISKSMNSNSEEILSYVYEKRVKSKKISAEKIHSEIVKKWPECTDIKPKDIQVMFDEIDLVNEDKNFVNGRKYSIEYIRDSKNNEKEIVPFSFDHTGILERNKEFSGFIQQFIAIKERKKTKENIVFKDISMNYLYVSHPIYVGLYGNVCGLTGTIGNKTDKDIFKNHYHLETQKIPRSNPNRRYEFPIILCDNIKERNDQVVNEIIEFHKIGIPILAIFFNPNEIEVIKKRIESHKDFQSNKVEIGIYNGKNDKIKPDESAGKEGAISLGTNVCGRGTHIKVGDKPLHVIVTFYSSNARSMNQAFGRTSRQKNFGTIRVICLAKEFFIETKKIKVNDINNNLERLKTINDIQLEYINEFIQSRDWIFDCDVKSQKISHDDLKTMRDVDINVNRVNACKFKFPICMSIDTFLDIQSQKIFSLYNCPNCKFTWMLFQQYVREMILESWSIFMNKIERKYHLSNKKESYTNYVSRKKQKLMDKLLVYFPVDDEEKLGIVPTFMHIFNLVTNKYNNKILRIYNNLMPSDDTEEDMSTKKPKMSLIRLGFRPYSLIQKSGSKIYSLLFREPKTLYIEDPELKYIQRGSPYLSITQKIDNIFNLICNFFSKLIGDKIGFKFFLRRTLGGCEFGICYDFDLENDDDELKTIQNCLIDKDPLFIFSINVKSMVPFLAGVLIFSLLYIANIARQLATIIQQIPKISVKVIKKAVVQLGKFVAEKAFGELEDQVCDALCDYLKNVLDNQIAKIQFTKRNYYLLFKMLSELLVDNHVADFGEKIHEKFQDKIKINTSTTFGKIMDAGMQSIFKVGFLVILCAASFLINFQINKSIKYSRSKVAAEFTKDQDENKIRNYVANNEKIFDKEIPQP